MPATADPPGLEVGDGLGVEPIQHLAGGGQRVPDRHLQVRDALRTGEAERQRLVEGIAGQCPPDDVAQRDGQDTDRDVQAERARRARFVRRPGREVQHVSGRQLDVAEAVDRPHLVPVDLQGEHGVPVDVAAKGRRARRAEVGVGLHRMADLRFEGGAELGQRQPRPLEALEDDRGAAVDEVEDAVDVRHFVDDAPRHPRRRGVGLDRQRDAVGDEPEPGPPAEQAEHLLDVVDVEEVAERPSGRAVQRPPPPDRRTELLLVADAALKRVVGPVHLGQVVRGSGFRNSGSGHSNAMSNLNDDDITRQPTEADDDRDAGGHGDADTGDEPTERDDDRDAGGEGPLDTGDEA